MRAIINAIKHYKQFENSSIASGAKRTMLAVNAVAQSGVTNPEDVVEGSVVKAVYIEVWLKSNSAAGTDNKFQLCIEKIPAGATSITFAQMNSLMSYPNKKNIFYFTQGVTGDLTTASVAAVRGWFKVPKGKQRFGIGDEFAITASATGSTYDSCGFVTFKEYK